MRLRVPSPSLATFRTIRVRRLLRRLRSTWNSRHRHRLLPRPRRSARSTSIVTSVVPARVDNEAKACLDDVALNLQQQTDATAVVVGEAASDERHADTLAAQRAVNTKDYLVTEKGIDASRISVRTGTQGNKEVENYLVPVRRNLRQRRTRHHSGRRKYCEGSSQNSAARPPQEKQPPRRSKC